MRVTVKRDVLEKVDEKNFLIAIIGNLEAVKNNGITIDEAEKFLFSPHMANKLKKEKCDEKIIELIKKGCELEDVASLIPERFDEVIDEMKRDALVIIQNYEEYNKSFWIEE